MKRRKRVLHGPVISPLREATLRSQVLEEDASVVNPMISSALRCVHGAENTKGEEPRRGSIRETPNSSLLTPHS